MTPFKTRFSVAFAMLATVDAAAVAVQQRGTEWWPVNALALVAVCLINLPALLPLALWVVLAPGGAAGPTAGSAALGGFACLCWAALTAWPWRGVGRFGPGLCWRCGYDLSGHETDRCPECGEPTGARLFRAAVAAAERRRRS